MKITSFDFPNGSVKCIELEEAIEFLERIKYNLKNGMTKKAKKEIEEILTILKGD